MEALNEKVSPAREYLNPFPVGLTAAASFAARLDAA